MTANQLLAYMREAAYKPMNVDELISALEVTEIREFIALLKEMEDQGLIIFTRNNRYGLPEKMNLFAGRFQAHQKGFGFLIPDLEGQSDIFVGADNTNGAMHNDRIMVRMMKPGRGDKLEGEVIRILTRANTRVVGTFEDAGRYGFVRPDEKRLTQDIFVAREDYNGAVDGDKVVVEVTRWPEARRNPEGSVVEIFGQAGAPGVDILSIVKKYQLPEEFPGNVLKEAEKVAVIREADYQDRLDLRDLLMVTIDGEDAKDLDDAVSLEMLPDGSRRLGVHIADVSHYVREDSLLDKEAAYRGTSVYLADRVIPMLPRELSNDICSLNANVDRLAMTCFMVLDEDGQLTDHQIATSVIRVRERMTYTAVNKILNEADPELTARYASLVPFFRQMADLLAILRRRRFARGAINFDFPEAKVILDAEGKAEAIVKRVSDTAEQLIEEFMIAANETVAADYFQREAPFLYRIHEQPDPDKMEELNEFLHRFGYHIKGSGSDYQPKAFQEIVAKVVGSPEERVISTMMLRSMRHARYFPEALGHFGLASKYYSHFTSPIRRYPDLVIHRVIKEYLAAGGPSGKRKKNLAGRMKDYAEHSSLREKLAEEAERESVDLKKAEYMERHVGETFPGIISGVTAFGLFVALENTVEGLVHVSTLSDDYYEFQEKMMALLGRHTNRQLKLGDAVTVKLVRVNVAERNIDFELVQKESAGAIGGAVSPGSAGRKPGDRKPGSRKPSDRKPGGREEMAGKKKPTEKPGKKAAEKPQADKTTGRKPGGQKSGGQKPGGHKPAGTSESGPKSGERKPNR